MVLLNLEVLCMSTESFTFPLDKIKTNLNSRSNMEHMQCANLPISFLFIFFHSACFQTQPSGQQAGLLCNTRQAHTNSILGLFKSTQRTVASNCIMHTFNAKQNIITCIVCVSLFIIYLPTLPRAKLGCKKGCDRLGVCNISTLANVTGR